MDLRDFSEIGQQIERTVKNAVDSMNFDKLNQNINETFNNAFQNQHDGAFHYKPKNPYENSRFNQNTAGNENNRWHYEKDREKSAYGTFNRFNSQTAQNMRNTQSHSRQAARSRGRQNTQTGWGAQPRAEQNTQTTAVGFPVMSDPPGRISSILMMVFGYSGLAISGAALVISLAFSAAIGRFFSVGAAFSMISLPIITISAILAISGTKTRKRLSRFKQYIGVLKGRTFCSLKELSEKIGKSKKYVFKDVRKMIGDGFFPEGHIDEQKTCLMVTDKIYEQYMIAQQGMKERAAMKDTGTRDEAEDEHLTSSQSAAFDKIIADGEVYMQHIREANDAIPDTEISNKLYRMELIIKKIFDYVRSHPEQIAQLRRFIDYYMPTTDKLVNAYKEFDTQPIQGENIKNAKFEIAKALDTINDAYEKLYDSMYAEAAMDVASDISVLQTLLAQEGLTKDDFNHGRKNK